MTIKQLARKYRCKSVPEFVTMTILTTENGRMVGCEGGKFDGLDFCQACKIGKSCYMRIFWVFGGGTLTPLI